MFSRTPEIENRTVSHERLPVRRPVPRQPTPARARTSARRGARRARARWRRRRTRSGRPASARARCTAATTSTTRFLNEAFGLFAHVNVLQRDMCPSATKFEGEIIAMTARPDARRGGRRARRRGAGHQRRHREHHARRCSPTASAAAPSAASPRPNIDQARDRAPRLRQGRATSSASSCCARRRSRDDFRVDVDWVRERRSTTNTVALIGSACNYGYGTIDPIAELVALALEHDVGLHVDGCLGGFILPFGRAARLRHPARSTSGCPASRRSRPTRTSTATRSRARRSCCSATRPSATRQYFTWPGWSGGKYMLAGHGGLALRVASSPRRGPRWCSSGEEGYLRLRASRSSRRPTRMQAGARRIPSCGSSGRPTFLLQLHLRRVRHLPRQRLHAASAAGASTASSTRTRCTWRHRPADAAGRGRDVRVGPGRRRARTRPLGRQPARAVASGALYGGVAGGLTDEAEEFIRAVMTDMLDTQQSLPPDAP